MTTPNFAKLFADNWSSFLGAFVGAAFGACIGHLVIYSFPPDVRLLRRTLGRALDRFRDVPSKRLDAALLGTAAQRRWRTARSILAMTFCMWSAIFASQLFRALFPELPRWHTHLVAGLAAGMGAWGWWRFERMAILRRVERVHQEPLPCPPQA